ncbi:MAG: dienelactone hydrolase family protein [Anaerolineae bacterium]|nr:dienelactone hydrolase family protein [Anaerolineae bacterium]
MRRMLLLILLLGLIPPARAQDATPEVQMFSFADLERTYTLHVPPGLAEPAPVVIILHGRGGTGQQMAVYTGFDELADREGFIALYPDGVEGEWDYVKGVPGYPDAQDDTAFLVGLVDHLAEDYPVDLSRVYVAGFSNGGFMAERIACENSPRFAAYASVAASGFGGMTQICAQSGQSPIVLIHGTADNNVPWQGLSVTRGERTVYVTYPVPETMAYWAEFNGCGSELKTDEVPESGDSPGTGVRILTVTCPPDASVIIYAVLGGGHNWPGRDANFPAQIAGTINRDIDATEVIWTFFAQHQRPLSTADS